MKQLLWTELCCKPAVWLSSVLQRKLSDLQLSVEEPAEDPERVGEPEAGGGHAGRPHQKLRSAALRHYWRHGKRCISFHSRLGYRGKVLILIWMFWIDVIPNSDSRKHHCCLLPQHQTLIRTYWSIWLYSILYYCIVSISFIVVGNKTIVSLDNL